MVLGEYFSGAFSVSKRTITTTQSLSYIHMRTRLRCIDNSQIGKKAMLAGKPPMVIGKCGHVGGFRYGRPSGLCHLGDEVSLAVLGELKRGYIVGERMYFRTTPFLTASTDTNNVVLLDKNRNPLGTRILLPIPLRLREKKGDFAKILAIATKFI